jgi:RNA polymerase sigma-70 factor (ECF subfamily)
MLTTVRTPQAEFEELAQAFGPELVRYAYEKTGSLDDAADMVQSALLKAWTVYSQGARPDHPRAWLYRIVHNESFNFRRQSRRRGPATSEIVEPDSLLSAELRETAEAVRELPSPFNDAIALHYLQGLSISEMAEVLDIPEGTAKSQIARGLELLRKKLGE